jgi:hypothetical protein
LRREAVGTEFVFVLKYAKGQLAGEPDVCHVFSMLIFSLQKLFNIGQTFVLATSYRSRDNRLPEDPTAC